MRQLLGDLFVTRLEVALEIALPYLIVGFFLGVVAFSFIYLGRRIERFEWRRELEAGNRMGDVVREKIGKRDRRIKQLTQRVVQDEAALEWAEQQQREIAILNRKIALILLEEPPLQAKASRRRRA
ncbi:hypothetical protein LCGC14_1767330 [marine sediment metagenome]|uniref:Uncharacterized protein n=1 Tax=marine sediment metagenome TaxID=412755 RepID=A0A0F9JZ04_9ZZZZ